MTQNWTEDVFALSHEGETDLQNVENNFQCLRTLFSGASFSINTDPGHPWYDTSTPALGEGLLKIRKQGDDGWLGVLALAQESNNGLVWFHGDNLSNQEGWIIDTQITEDRVMALKNHGSGTYTTGRQVFGSWNITGVTVNTHRHTTPNHLHYLATGATFAIRVKSNALVRTDSGSGSSGGQLGDGDVSSPASSSNITKHVYYYTVSGGAGLGGYTAPGTTSDGSWKIKAQVGIVIYPDI